ncbi:MAG: hypothetical protein AAFN91_12805 [Pseudomonadota bacterium]
MGIVKKHANRYVQQALLQEQRLRRLPNSQYFEIAPSWAIERSRFPRSYWPIAGISAGLKNWKVATRHDGARALSETISTSLNCSLMSSRALLLFNHVCASQLWLDQAYLLSAKPAELQNYVSNKVLLETPIPLGEINTLLRLPSLFLISTFASHYYAILALAQRMKSQLKISIVQPAVALKHLSEVRFYDRLAKLFGIDFELIQSDANTALVRALHALKKGRHVALRFDSLPTEANTFVSSELLGKPSIFPLAILKLSDMTQRPIIPIASVRKGTQIKLFLDNPVSVSGLHNQSYIDAAIEIDSFQTKYIRKFPVQYSAWFGVHQKWTRAEEIASLAA